MGGGKESGTDVEHLVGRVAAGQEGDPRWSALLVVLTAASRGADVDPEREQAAVVAFRAAANARPARRVRGRPRRRSLRSARMLAGGLAAVFALCGVAVAAGTGVLPARGHAAHGGPPPAPVAPATSAPAPARPVPEATRRPAPAQPSGDASAAVPPAPGSARSPDPPRDRSPAAVRALCRVYLAAVRDGRRPAAQQTARLQREAGGSRQVAAYCRALLSGGPGAVTK